MIIMWICTCISMYVVCVQCYVCVYTYVCMKLDMFDCIYVFMHVCVCVVEHIYVWFYVGVYTHVSLDGCSLYACKIVCKCVYTCMLKQLYVYECTYGYINEWINVHEYESMWMIICIWMNVCVYIHMHVFICIFISYLPLGSESERSRGELNGCEWRELDVWVGGEELCWISIPFSHTYIHTYVHTHTRIHSYISTYVYIKLKNNTTKHWLFYHNSYLCFGV